MAPLMDTPATRREAIASLLAMLAFVRGTGQSGTAEVSSDSDETSEPVEQPAPATSTRWESLLMLHTWDESLPLRSAYLDATFTWSGDAIQLDLTDSRNRIGKAVEDHGTGPPVARFKLVGAGATFLDAISADADASWERSELNWLENPREHCPVCDCQWPERDSCPNCGQTGWVVLSPTEAKRRSDRVRKHRQMLIDAAVAAAEK